MNKVNFWLGTRFLLHNYFCIFVSLTHDLMNDFVEFIDILGLLNINLLSNFSSLVT